jgi:hypothetical protein
VANVKISALPAISSLTGTEAFPVVQSGTTSRITAANLQAYLATDTYVRNHANAAFIQANTPSYTANSAASYANAAFITANAASYYANLPSYTANSASSYANAAFITANAASYYANVPSYVANSSSAYANAAFLQANTPSYTANSASVYANAAFITANAASYYANLPSAIANSGASYANAAFTAANTASATNLTQNNSITAAFNTANAAFTAANNTTIKNTSSWTVATGTNTYSITVPDSGTYQIWIRGNIPNGIIAYLATVVVTNINVPVVGAQYAWVYNGGGTPLDFTSIPNQFTGTANTIVRSSTSPSATTNRFDFGINNTSGSSQTVQWGYVTLS